MMADRRTLHVQEHHCPLRRLLALLRSFLEYARGVLLGFNALINEQFPGLLEGLE